MAKALYAFSGDPITYGHVDIIERAARLFDPLIIGIGTNRDKVGTYLFTPDERLEMAQRTLGRMPHVSVVTVPTDYTLVDYAYEHSIPAIVKGVRNLKDFNYEEDLHRVGDSQQHDIETIPLFAKPELLHISSSAAKQLQRLHGDVHKFVPPYIKQCLEAKISHQYVVAVTGTIGAGKSYMTDKLVEAGAACGVAVHNIDLDRVGHAILSELSEPAYCETRERIAETFAGVRNPDGTIDRRALGRYVFEDPAKLTVLNAIMRKPLLTQVRRRLSGKDGIILLNGAIIAEAGWAYMSNYNAVLITADEQSQRRRLRARTGALTDEQIDRRVQSQCNALQKSAIFEAEQRKHSHGKLWTVDNSDGTAADAGALLEEICQELRVPVGAAR